MLFVYFQIEGKGGGKRGGETSMCVEKHQSLPLAHLHLGTQATTQACALTGTQTSKLLVYRLVLNLLSPTSRS